MRDNEKDLVSELNEQESDTKKCVEEMTEQYKRMEKKLQSDIDTLIGNVDTQEVKIDDLNQEITKLKEEKEKISDQYEE